MPGHPQHVCFAFGAARFGDTVDAAEEVDVLFHREVVVERELLRHVTDVLFDGFRLRHHIQAAHGCAAGSGQQQPAQHADGGGFARAVGSQESENLAAADVEIHMVHGDKVAEAFHELANFDSVIHVVWTGLFVGQVPDLPIVLAPG